MFKSIKRLNAFERKWLYNVRMELYWGELLTKIMGELRMNIKYEKTKRALAQNRCFFFL